WRGGLVLAGALGAQLVFDYTGSVALEWAALAVPPLELVRPLLWAFSFDVLVAPLAYGMVVADRAQPGALLLPLPLLVLLLVFVRERRERLDSLLELSSAYQGTAFLLGDVVARVAAAAADAAIPRGELPVRHRRVRGDDRAGGDGQVVESAQGGRHGRSDARGLGAERLGGLRLHG